MDIFSKVVAEAVAEAVAQFDKDFENNPDPTEVQMMSAVVKVIYINSADPGKDIPVFAGSVYRILYELRF